MRIIILFIIFLIAPLSNADATPAMQAEFAASFHTGYVESKCGQNIANFILRLQAQGVDLSRARVGMITNSGYYFSVTHRRNSGPRLQHPTGSIRAEPGISNFFHHVIFEYDGFVYDYDFGNSPRIVSIKTYIKTMFWDEPPITQYSGLERLDLRKKYQIAFTPALTYLKAHNTGTAPKINLIDFYNELGGDRLPSPVAYIRSIFQPSMNCRTAS